MCDPWMTCKVFFSFVSRFLSAKDLNLWHVLFQRVILSLGLSLFLFDLALFSYIFPFLLRWLTFFLFWSFSVSFLFAWKHLFSLPAVAPHDLIGSQRGAVCLKYVSQSYVNVTSCTLSISQLPVKLSCLLIIDADVV